MIPSKLLEHIHQSRYVYIDKNRKEVYVWYGSNVINIYNYIGDEVSTCNIIKYTDNREYRKYEQINLRDVTISIDDIVHANYNDEKEKAIK